MPIEAVQFGLLLAGWIVAFMLGKELHSGFSQWRSREAASAEARRKRD